jgi:hypothetical protein
MTLVMVLLLKNTATGNCGRLTLTYYSMTTGKTFWLNAVLHIGLLITVATEAMSVTHS